MMVNSIDQGQKLIDQLAEEFVERLRRGERPAIPEYAERYPELGDKVRSLFPTLVLMEQLKPGSLDELDGLPTSAETSAGLPTPQLGDFRIIREVGRGGMGVVYEAEQVSLGRRVALKVLSKRCLRDDLQRKRFQREARAAARLHHTNIVPVFGVGEQDSMLYYVMQFIQGQGLDVVLLELKRLRKTGAWKEPGDALRGGVGIMKDAATNHGTPRGDMSAEEVAHSLTTGVFRPHMAVEAHGSCDDAVASATVVLPLPAIDHPAIGEPRTSTGDTAAGPSTDKVNRSGVQRLVDQGASGVHGSRIAYWQSVARIGQQVAQALEYAHEQGIIHRDIKPANLLLDTRGTVWVTDFGLAKAEDQQDLTQTGDVLGTLRYMAPEQFQGQGDVRSDVYSLGMTLYELLVLRSAYEGTDRAQLVQKVLHESPPRLRALDPTIPRDLETIVNKAIDREPAHRYLTASELAADLQRYLGDEPIRARRVSLAARLTRWCRKNRVVAMLTGLAAALLVLVMVVLAVSQIQIARQRDRFRDALAQSLVAEARFRRSSGEIGQRAESLLKLTEATALRPGTDLRDEVIRCLALHDLERMAEWPAGFPNHSPDSITFDPSLAHYVSYDAGAVEIRRTPDAGSSAGPLVKRLAMPPFSPRVAKFSRDGSLLALRMNDEDRSKLSVWDWQNQHELLTVTGVTERAFDFDRAGLRLVCGLRDGTTWKMRTYDLASGSVLATWTLPNQPTEAHFEPDGPLVACSLPGASHVQVFDSRNGKVVHELDFGQDIYALAWHPAGDQLAVGHGFDVSISRLDNPPSQVMVLRGHRWVIHALQYHPSGEFLVSHSLREGVTRLWDLRMRRELLVAPGHFVRFDADGTRLAFVHTATLGLTRLLGEDEYQTLADSQADSTDSWRSIQHPTLPVMVDCGRHGIRCWDIRRRHILAASPREMVYTACFDPLSDDLLTAGAAGLQRWKLQVDGHAEHASLSPPQPLSFTYGKVAAPATGAFGLVCTSDGRMRIAAFRGEPFLYVQDVPTGRIRLLPCDPKTAFIAVSPNGRWIAAGNHNNPGFYVWDTRQEGAGRLLAASGSAAQVAFSPDGEHLIACANDRYVLYRVGTWEVLSEIIRPALIEGTAAFSPDGRILALSAGPGEVQLHEVNSGRILVTLDSGRDPINILNMQFAPQRDDVLYLACGPSGVRIWDLAKVRRTLRGMRLDW